MNFTFVGMRAYRGQMGTFLPRYPSHVYCFVCRKRLSVKSGVCEGDDGQPHCYECAKQMGNVKTIREWHENQLFLMDRGESE